MKQPAASIPLPPRPPQATPDAVEQYAAACLTHLHLHDWHFGWDKTVRRLGCCKMQQRRISLSCYYAEAYAAKEPAQLWRTLLHELAHALAWVHHRASGHGAVWQRYCAALGIAGERASTRGICFSSPRPPRPARFSLCHRDTGEVYRTYTRKPRISARRLQSCYIPGRKVDTLGKLTIKSLES